MKITGRLADSCPNGKSCDRIHDTDGDHVLIQATRVTDPAIIAAADPNMPDHEALLIAPRTLLEEPYVLTLEQIEEWFDRHKPADILRVENRPAYLVDSDGNDYERFQKGLAPASDSHAAWLGYLDETDETWRRIRLFHGDDIGDYGRYECHAFVDSVEHGEQIRVVSDAPAASRTMLVALPDYFVLDSKWVLRSVYDEVGRHLGGVIVHGPDVIAYQVLAETLWSEGVDFHSWWAANPQHHRALRAA